MVKRKSKAASKKRRKVAAALGVSEAEQAASEAALEEAAEEAALASVAKLPPLPPVIPWVAPLGPPEIPSAWRDGGYLALAINFHGGAVTFISSSGGGETSRLELPKFWQRVRAPSTEVDPVRCILSFLARERSGLFNMRARDIRRIVEMLTRDVLEKMSERDLGNEYRKLVDPKGPQRIKTDKKADFIEKILAKAKEMGAKAEASEAGPKVPKPPKEKKIKPPKEPKAPKPPKEKKIKAGKEPELPKEPKKSAKEIKAAGGNPFREGSMKHKAFAVFVSSKGDRSKTVEAATKAGSTPSTASSWYAAFTKL